jgi:folate-dependent phosphoribosylglycinamide formyltransferase PurN
MMFAVKSARWTQFVSNREYADAVARARAADGETTETYQIFADNTRDARDAFNNEWGLLVATTSPDVTVSL